MTPRSLHSLTAGRCLSLFLVMSLKRQHSKKDNFVSSNAGVSGRDLDIASIDFSRDIVDKAGHTLLPVTK